MGAPARDVTGAQNRGQTCLLIERIRHLENASPSRSADPKFADALVSRLGAKLLRRDFREAWANMAGTGAFHCRPVNRASEVMRSRFA